MDSVEKYQVLVNILNLCKREDREQDRAGQELDLHSDKAEQTDGFLKRMSRERKKHTQANTAEIQAGKKDPLHEEDRAALTIYKHITDTTSTERNPSWTSRQRGWWPKPREYYSQH